MEPQVIHETTPARMENGGVKARKGGRRWWALAIIAGVALALFVVPRVSPEQAAAIHPDYGMVCTDGPDFDLRATDGYISAPDGNSIYMWSYAIDEGPDTVFQYPGPTLCVDEGDTVTVHLTNDLPDPVSILFLGQEGVEADDDGDTVFELAQPQFDLGMLTSLTNFAPPPPALGEVTYKFVASEPGTYIYESGTEPDKQMQMGLVGALIVRPTLDTWNGVAGNAYAYDETTEYNPDREFLLLLHEIDPFLHTAVELGQPYNITELEFHYWTINGRSMPDVVAPNDAPWLPGQPYSALVIMKPFNDDPLDTNYNPLPALVRMANPGMANHPFHPHANHVRVIAQDGRLLKGPLGEDLSYEKFTRTTGSGQTFDAMFKWTDVEGFRPVTAEFGTQCGADTTDDDDDGKVNDGCPAVGPAETDCDDSFDDDVDLAVNDGCPVFGKPVPVQIPGLQNLVFKDDATFYSGSPYLGYQGELPVGVTSYNQCGEQYFPWHTHALNEFQNFNEGFGGLGTVLMVLPPGGCP